MLAVVASRSSSHLMAITASGGSVTGRRASTIYARSSSFRRDTTKALFAYRAKSVVKNNGLSCTGIIFDRSFSSFTENETSNARNHPPTSHDGGQRAKVVDAYVSGNTTHFGYEDVPLTEKELRVRKVFESVADNYDVMNDLMSGGLHRLWKDELLAMTGVGPIAKAIRSKRAELSQHESEPLFSILDVAGGTGDVAFRFVDAADCQERAKSSGRDEISVTVCDINPAMLDVGKSRARDRYGDSLLKDTQALIFKEGNAQCLPFEDGSFDLYTIAFGLRNVTDVDMALRDAYRVLKPGGRYLCLEFSHMPNQAMQALYDAYSFNVIPTVGEIVANDRASYQYLVESIRKFSNQEELKARLETAGFTNVTYTNMTGGIVAVHSGYKPL